MPGNQPAELAYPDPPLTDGRVRLRAWRLDDVGCVEAASADPRIAAATSVPADYTPGEGAAFVRRQWSRVTDGVGVSLAIADAECDEAVGFAIINLRPQPGVGGIGYWVVSAQRGKGWATAAIRLLTPWALSTLGLHRVEAWVEPDNVASQHALLAAGFEIEGRLRNYLTMGQRVVDAVVLSRVR